MNRSKPDDSHKPIDFNQLFDTEREEIRQARLKRLPSEKGGQADSQANGGADEMRLMGLALSGGGIRSATFGLGVLEALAERGILKHFDYLSTVSGGGYIGSWLSAWIMRETPKNPDSPGHGDSSLAGINKVEAELSGTAGRSGSTTNGSEPPQIRYLRQYSNYLTPRNGFFSADTWATISTYVRNSSITFLILALAFAALLLVPRVLVFIFPSLPTPGEGQHWTPWAMIWLAVAGIGIFECLRRATAKISTNLQVVDPQGDHQAAALGSDTQQVQTQVVLPIALSAFFATSIWLSLSGGQAAPPLWSSLIFAAGGGLLYGLLFSLAWSPRDAHVRRQTKKTALFAGVVGGLVLYAIASWLDGIAAVLLLTWGPPLLILVALVTVTVHVALIGRYLAAEVHEWLLRLGGWLSIYMSGWIALFFFSLYSPIVFYEIEGEWIRRGIGIGWVVSTLAGVLAGRTPQTGQKNGKSPLELVAKVAPFVFILGLLGLIAIGINELVGNNEMKQCLAQLATTKPSGTPCAIWGHYWKSISDSGLQSTLLLGLCIFLLWIFSRVDINLFSLHYYYRNRLIRCYLGASRWVFGQKAGEPRPHETAPSGVRQPNPFTGFDGNDDPKLRDVWKQNGPYHIINTALNLVGGKDLAWQQRKACSFVFTPRGYGFDPDKAVDPSGTRGYRRIRRHDDASTHGESGNPSLGEALAISGAAFSPNMGYHSSPAVSFLLAVFNVRLGYWFRNPVFLEKGTGFANLPYLIYELLGMTDETKEYAYLSDGGHFENLGIYELVRRRCRYIVAVDAGQDGTFGFEDLGNAIRKCQIDFGIDIRIDTYSIIPQSGSRWSERHCAVGTIHYPGGRRGTLVYLKPSLSGREPADVLEYAGSHPAFPHETTADQWFDESQFESYRKLGYHIGTECFRTAFERVHETDGQDFRESLFSELRQHWVPSTPIPREVFTRQGQALSDLMDRLSRDDRLRFLDAEVYPEWNALLGTFDRDDREKKLDQMRLPVSEEQGRAGFYFCNGMIQLAENVYCDLSLEEYWDHPDNRGWINLFRHWAASDMLRKTWAITAPTFGARFQMFCQHRFGFPNQTHVTLAKPILLDVSRPGANRALLKSATEQGLLNEVETGIILAIVGYEENAALLSRSGADLCVIPLQLDVPQLACSYESVADEADHPPLLRFTFGFALTLGNNVVYFRIQDHLRKAGLGRRALVKLGKLQEVSLKADGQVVELEVPQNAYEVPTASDRQRFRVLTRSVSFMLDESDG